MITLKERLFIATVITLIIGTIGVICTHSIEFPIGAAVGSYGYQLLAHWICKIFNIDWL